MLLAIVFYHSSRKTKKVRCFLFKNHRTASSAVTMTKVKTITVSLSWHLETTLCHIVSGTEEVRHHNREEPSCRADFLKSKGEELSL